MDTWNQKWNRLRKDPGIHVMGTALTLIVGIWFAKITPIQSNVFLIFCVLLFGVGVSIFTRALPFPLMLICVLGSCAALGFISNELVWIPRADTLEVKKTVLAPVENADYRNLVAEIVQSFEPDAYISVAGKLIGPDGARTVDIQVWPARGSVRGPTVIDVIDRPEGKRVGIEAIDAADSKRRDVRANRMFVCSNTGFDAQAIQKAKRLTISLISVLKQGDLRIKAKIEEEIYLRKVNVSPVTITFDGATPADGDTLRRYNPGMHDVKYGGRSVDIWLQRRVYMFIALNPKIEGPLIMSFELKQPTQFLVQDRPIILKALSIQFHPKVQWLSQVVTLDAKNGIYDYVRGRVRLAGGPNSYVISGVN